MEKKSLSQSAPKIKYLLNTLHNWMKARKGLYSFKGNSGKKSLGEQLKICANLLI